MKRHYSLLVCVLISMISMNLFAQHASIKCSPQTRLLIDFLSKGNEKSLPHSIVYKTINNQIYLSGLIKVNSTFHESQLTSLGVLVGTKAGMIRTVQIPVAKLKTVINLSSVDYVEVDTPTFPTLDNARIDTRADSVHEGLGIPMPINGQGVVIGVVDVGFDLTHPTFFDTAGVNYRIKRAWQQKNTLGTPPANYAYGTEFTDSLQMWNQGTDNIEETHGTHVAGIAGGSGLGSPVSGHKFKGFGYKSDLVLVSMTPDKSQWISTGISDMIDGINYVYDYATSVSKPSVVNLSWGSPLGPHDGTSLFSQAIDNITGPGRIFVCSAGNNGGDSIHVQKTFSSTDTIVNTYLSIADSPEGKKTWVDIWGQTGESFCLNISLVNGTVVSSTGNICLDDSVHTLFLLDSNNDTLYLSVVTAASEFNSKPRIFVDFDSHVADDIQLSITGTSGTIHMWNSFVSNTVGYYGAFLSNSDPSAVNGDKELTISDIASTNSAISVGAYASKIGWTNISGAGYSYSSYVSKGNLVPFSSHGPTVDNRIKPDITGPGLTVGSSISSFDSSFMSTGPSYLYIINSYHFATTNKNYTYGMLSGTSMSSPAVSGITSMLLQVKGDLTPQEVKDIYTLTAIKDNWTGVIPAGGNATWGNGKVNAIGSVMRAMQLVNSVPVVNSLDLDLSIYPNPGTGEYTIECTSGKNETMTVTCFDMVGKEIIHEQWNFTAGMNTKQFSLSDYSNGVYFVKVSSEKGSSISKLIKQ